MERHDVEYKRYARQEIQSKMKRKCDILAERLACLFLFTALLFMVSCTKTETKQARVSFQFDDGSITQYTLAKPLFDSKGIKASVMVTTGFLGKKYYMSWDQVRDMYEQEWEIGSHTVTHTNLRTANEETVRFELAHSKAELQAHEIKNVTNFAYPYNFYNMDVLYVTSEYYRSARTSVAQTGFRIIPHKINPYELSSYECRLTVDNVADAFRYVDKAQKEGRWLIFMLHEFIDEKSAARDDIKNNREVTDVKALGMLIDYIQERDIPVVTTEQALNYYIGNE